MANPYATHNVFGTGQMGTGMPMSTYGMSPMGMGMGALQTNGFQTHGVQGAMSTGDGETYADVFPGATPTTKYRQVPTHSRGLSTASEGGVFDRLCPGSRMYAWTLCWAVAAGCSMAPCLMHAFAGLLDKSFESYSRLLVAVGSSVDLMFLLHGLVAVSGASILICTILAFAACQDRQGSCSKVVVTFVSLALLMSVVLFLTALDVRLTSTVLQPTVIRAANEVCRTADSTNQTWKCTASSTATSSPRRLFGPTPHGGAATYLADIDALADRCERLERMCLTPNSFILSAACMCSGESSAVQTTAHTNHSSASIIIGGYCGSWGVSNLIDEWCYVGRGASCGDLWLDAQTGFYGSAGPCTSTVESRSALVNESHDTVKQICLLMILPGLLLMITSCTAVSAWKEQQQGPKTQLFTEEADAESLPGRFDKAQREVVQKMNQRPPSSEKVKLEIWGLYKQAKAGDCNIPRPAAIGLEQRKWEAWNTHKGLPQSRAMEKYIQAARKL